MRFTGLGIVAVTLVLVVPRVVRAEHVRAHGSLGLAKAVGGYQERELSFGAAGFVAAEMPLIPQLGAQLELGTLLLGDGDDPKDAAIQPEGGAHAIYGGIGLHTRPFVTHDPTEVSALTGTWLAANVGATTTGGLFRSVVDLHVGYDFLVEGGRYGVGPTLGWVHVFQGNDELRPDDANVLVLGVHVMFDSGPRVRPAPPDRDGDGIVDRVDRCPDVREDKDGFEDQDGCPEEDNDKDGVLDPEDRCVLVPEDRDGFEDKDGCPETDNDQDGIPDAKDSCPLVPEDKDGFEDEDGCPDTDNDKDGILDRTDLCPNEPETENDYADDDGCPDEDQVRVVGEKIVLDDRVHFEQNNAIIRPVSHPLLERLARLIKSQPSYSHIEVQGHTDQKGTVEFNQKLSEDRAKSVLEFLVRQGVERGRLSAVGRGSSQLLVEKTNERALYLNRRVEFVITREIAKSGATSPPPAGTGPAGESQEPVAPPAPAPVTP